MHEIREILGIHGGIKLSQFDNDLLYEEKCYEQIVKPYLHDRGLDSVFVRFDSDNIIHSEIQKKYDIDLITDDQQKNYTLSIKSRRKIYSDIFYETVKNTNTGEPGWGFYTKADYIFYVMIENGEYDIVIFDPKKVQSMYLEGYVKRYGKTFGNKGEVLYKTEGRIIPIKDLPGHRQLKGLVS